MVSKKYTDDYRTESTIDENGKVIRKAVYIGPYYVHAAPEKDVRLSKRLCLPMAVLL